MVRATWKDGKLVVIPVTEEEEANLPQFVRDTLAIGEVAVHDRMAFANNEQHARDRLEEPELEHNEYGGEGG